MLFMNEWDIEETVEVATRLDNANQIKAAATLAQLAEWTNNNSDGWAYWPKPCRAAARLQEALQRMHADERRSWSAGAEAVVDFTDAEIASALAPIKTFLERHGADWRRVLPAATSSFVTAASAQQALF